MPFGVSALFDADILSRGGDGDMPVGEAMDAGKMNSSRFIGSGVLWSTDCLSLAMPEGALDLCWVKLFPDQSQSSGSTRTGKMSRFTRCLNLPSLFSFFAFQIHRHHSPRQVFHAFLVWQLSLRFAVQLPYLRRQRIFLLHFIWMF